MVGNRATGKCDIVTSNPVIGGGSAYDNGGGYSFGSGPYKSNGRRQAGAFDDWHLSAARSREESRRQVRRRNPD